MREVVTWASLGRYPKIIRKGMHPLTEHFGAIRANVPVPEDSATLENKQLLHLLQEAEHVYVAGEARSHCVANTIKQLFDYPAILKKIVLLNDCMSDVPGFESLAKPIYEKALTLGVRVATSHTSLV
jgi:nicotinamidase-related amidase